MTKKNIPQKYKVQIGNISMGADSPIRIQSMTDTPTSDIDATVKQIISLANAGAELVRITVDDDAAARAIPYIKEKLAHSGYEHLPLVGCFHYNGHQLLDKFQDCAKILDKYRINPGNVGFGRKQEKNFAEIIEKAIIHDKAIRIGVNGGSISQEFLAQMMNENAKKDRPLSSREVMRNAMVRFTLMNAEQAIAFGMQANKIVLSAKVSNIQDLVAIYRELAMRSRHPLHLGLTEAGMGIKGITSISMALAILLQEGIGDTIRASLTPGVHDDKIQEVLICKEVLHNLELRQLQPSIVSCPGCGRTNTHIYKTLAEDINHYINQSLHKWIRKYPGVTSMKIAVMGCIVNGPGESKGANIGISLPGKGEKPAAPVFIDGKKFTILRGSNIAEDFKQIIEEYIHNHYSNEY